MKCPKCGASLRRLKRGDVAIDACDLCYGIWLDRGELEQITSKEGKVQDSVKALKEVLSEEPAVTEEASKNCPRCEKPMKKVNFKTKDNVLADKCPECGGMWFDSGELISVTDKMEDEKSSCGCGSSCCGTGKNVSMLPSFLAIIGVLAAIGYVIYIVLKSTGK